jgi:hypothetical protein
MIKIKILKITLLLRNLFSTYINHIPVSSEHKSLSQRGWVNIFILTLNATLPMLFFNIIQFPG